MHRCTVSIALVLVLVVPALGESVEPTPAVERFDKDTAHKTPAGATFTVPAGWTMTTRGSMVVLDPPEPDSHVVFVDVSAKDAQAAVAAAWQAYKPDFQRPLRISLPQEARQGWDERKVFQYETSPNERVVVGSPCRACARRGTSASRSPGGRRTRSTRSVSPS
jgi:hypothetical protein